MADSKEVDYTLYYVKEGKAPYTRHGVLVTPEDVVAMPDFPFTGAVTLIRRANRADNAELVQALYARFGDMVVPDDIGFADMKDCISHFAKNDTQEEQERLAATLAL